MLAASVSLSVDFHNNGNLLLLFSNCRFPYFCSWLNLSIDHLINVSVFLGVSVELS